MTNRWEPRITPLVIALRTKLDEPGMTVRKAGTIIGVSPQTVSNWAHGTVSISISAETQAGLAQLLDVSPIQVLELAGLDVRVEALGGYLICA